MKAVARLRGGGSALPGLVAEKIDPQFLPRTLGKLPRGVVVISGTNGKTTTTKMVVELLQGQGLKVFTNRTGSNFTRGVVASVLGDSDARGRLDADIAVLELDEAHAVHFVKLVRPRYSLLLNVMRDQLDRFGEIETTAGFLRQIAAATTDAVVLNREDPRILALANSVAAPRVEYFGLAPQLRHMFPHDDEMRNAVAAEVPGAEPAGTGGGQPEGPRADVVLSACEGSAATFQVDGRAFEVELKLTGVYNVFNAAAALVLARTVLGPAVDEPALLASLENVTPAFGRGESLTVNGQPLDLVLVKNPAGFRLRAEVVPGRGLPHHDCDQRQLCRWPGYVLALGRGLRFAARHRRGRGQRRPGPGHGAAPLLRGRARGSRRHRPECLAAPVHRRDPDTPKRIYCTYTAMLALRRELGKLTEVEVVS